MNYQALYNEIMADPTMSALAVTADMPKQNASDKDQQIADILNQQTELSEVRLTVAGFLSRVGALTGGTIIGKLKTIALSELAVELALISLESSVGLNFGDGELQTMIDNLTNDSDPAYLTTNEANLVKNLGYVTRKITGRQVSIALRGNSQFTPVV